MRHDTIPQEGLSYAPCRYGSSRLLFRGPRRPLDGRYIAFVGGAETYGRFLARPFPALVEEALGEICVNFGQVNASVDAFLAEPAVTTACREATLTVVEVMGAANLSNRFYTVHPRRNDRFLRASSIMRAVFPEVDLAEICFTRHLLGHLHAMAPERFPILREELQTAWSARMRSFLERIGPRTLLLWFSPHLPSDLPWEEHPQPLLREPLFVTRRMLDSLRPLVRGVIMVQPSAGALQRRSEGLICRPQDRGAAAGLLGAAAHREAAAALAASIRAFLAPEASGSPGIAQPP